MSDHTLIDGRVVSGTSPEWAAECLQRHRHVQSMRALDLPGRRRYLEDVAKAEGQEASRRLAEAYREDWERRRAGL